MPDTAAKAELRGLLRSLVHHSATLFSGQFVATVFSFVSAIVTARYLGPAAFGLIVLVQVYVLIIDRLVNFQTWETLIRFGSKAEAEAEDSKSDFQDILSYCWQVDLATAVLGTAVAYALFPLFSSLYGLSADMMTAALFYPLVILLKLTGTSMGFLQLKKKALQLSIAATMTGAFRLALVVVGVALSLDVIYFLVAWAVAEMASNLAILAFGYREIRRHGFRPLRGKPAWTTMKTHRGLARFTVISNLHSSLVLACKEADQLIIGATLGLESVGILKIAKQFTLLISKPFDPIAQMIFPDLAKLASNREYDLFKGLLIRTSIGCGLAGLLAWIGLYLFGEPLILLTAGASYLDGYPVLMLYGVGVTIAVAATAMQPAMVSLGLQEQSFGMVLVSSIAYLALLPFTLLEYGLIGAGVAYTAFFVCQISGLCVFTYRRLHRLGRSEVTAAGPRSQ